MTQQAGLNTLCVHSARSPDPTTGALAAPIHLATTFERDADGAYPRGYRYSREGTPNRGALEACVAALEGGCGALAFASGLAANMAVLELLEAGERLVAPREAYYGTKKQFAAHAQRRGADVQLRGRLRSRRGPRGRRGRCAPGLDRDSHQSAAERRRPAPGHRHRARGGRARRVRQHLCHAGVPAPASTSAPTWWCTRPPSTSAATATCWAACSWCADDGALLERLRALAEHERRGAGPVRLLAAPAQHRDAGAARAGAVRRGAGGGALPRRARRGRARALSRAAAAPRPRGRGRRQMPAASARMLSLVRGRRRGGRGGRRGSHAVHPRHQPRQRREPDRAPRLDRGTETRARRATCCACRSASRMPDDLIADLAQALQ